MSNDLRDLAAGDRQRAVQNGVDLNPFSTPGARQLWMQGYAGVTPANLVEGSQNWRYWERGRQCYLLALEAA